MKSIRDVLTRPADRIAYGTYRFTRSVLWIPSSLWELAHAVVRRRGGFLERQGLYDVQRPAKNPIMWFHANSAGECVLCLPLIHRVMVEYNEKVLVLVTVRSEDALELLRSSLPERVLLLRAPQDTPFAVRRFLQHWRPCIGVMMSAWLAPNLVVMSTQASVPLALLDGSIPAHIFHFWHKTVPMRVLWRAMTSCFHLIIPHSDIEVGRFRLMGASLGQMPGWCNDLSYACSLSASVANLWRPPVKQLSALENLFAGRVAWMACHLLPVDESHLQHTHVQLRSEIPALLTVYVHQGPEAGCTVADEWSAAGIPAACSSNMPNSFDGVELLVVDTPWLTPLLMQVCEVVYIGSHHFSGEQNYMVVAQAAVSSCAVVASSQVIAHCQLAQELNSAAMNAAEDAAHAVRTAGVDTDAATPWNALMNGAGTPHSAATTENPLSPTPRQRTAATVQNFQDGAGNSSRSRSASRHLVFTRETLSSAGSSVVGSPSVQLEQGSIGAAAREGQPTERDSIEHAITLEQDDVLSTGCHSPLISQSPLHQRAVDATSDAGMVPPLTLCVPSPSGQAGPRPPMRSPPTQPATPPPRGCSEEHTTPPIRPIGLPLCRSPLPRYPRLLTPSPARAPEGSPQSSSCSTPFCCSTPSSLHMSILHPNMSTRRSPDCVTSVDPLEIASETPCKGEEESCLAINTPSPLPLQCSTPPWLAQPDSPQSSVLSPLATVGVDPVKAQTLCNIAALATATPAAEITQTGINRSGLEMLLMPSTVEVPHCALASAPPPFPLPTSQPSFAEDSTRHPQSNEGEPGAVQPVQSQLALPPSPPAKEAGTENHPDSTRTMIGSNLQGPVAANASSGPMSEAPQDVRPGLERSISRSLAGLSLSADSTGDPMRSLIGSERVPARPIPSISDAPPAAPDSLNMLVPERQCSPACVPPSETTSTLPVPPTCLPSNARAALDVPTLHVESASQESMEPAGDEALLSPVRTPAGLHRLRLQRARFVDTSESAVVGEAAGEAGSVQEPGTANDLWAGASPFMTSRARADLPSPTAIDPNPDGEASNLSYPLLPHLSINAAVSSQGGQRVTMRRALLRYTSNYLLSAMHLPQHPEGPAVLLLSQTEGLFDTISSLLREPVMRQSRGYVAVQAAARLSSSLVSTIWDVLDGNVLEPSLMAFESQGGEMY